MFCHFRLIRVTRDETLQLILVSEQGEAHSIKPDTLEAAVVKS